MFPPIPFDIPVAIIDQAADDPRSLRNLALTCHDFLSRSRYHLLAWYVSLRSPKMLCDFCHHLDANPHFRPFVRHLTLDARLELMNEEPSWTQALLSMIPTHLLKLPNLRHWKLQYFGDGVFSPCIDRLQLGSLRGDSVTITTLVLRGMIFLDLTEFALFLCAFPGLRSLKIFWMDFERDETEVAFMPARDRLAKQLRLTSLDTDFNVERSLTTLLLEIGQSTIEYLALPLPRREALGGERIHALVRGMSALRSVTISDLPHYINDATSFIVDIWELVKGLPTSPPRSHSLLVNSLSELHLALGKEPLLNICGELEQLFMRQLSHNIVFQGRGIKLSGETFWTTALSRHLPELHRQGRFIIEGDKSSDAYCMAGHDNRIWCLAVSPDSKWVASSSIDSTIIVWDAQSGNIILQWVVHERYVHDLAFSPDSRSLMSGGGDRLVIIWDLEGGGVRIATLEGHDSDVLVCAWSPDGTLLASGDEDGTVRVWDAKSFAQLHCFKNASSVHGQFVRFSPDGRWLAFLGGMKCGNIWDTVNCRSHKTLHSDKQLRGRASAFDPSSKRIAIAAADATVHVWDVTAETTEELVVLRGHEGAIQNIAFSPNGDRVLSVSYDKTAKIWDSHTGDMILSLEGHTDDSNAACFSPDGKYVASGSEDKTVRLWRTSDGSCVRTFTEHTHVVEYVLFSPDGETLCSGACDGTIIIRRFRDIVL